MALRLGVHADVCIRAARSEFGAKHSDDPRRVVDSIFRLPCARHAVGERRLLVQILQAIVFMCSHLSDRGHVLKVCLVTSESHVGLDKDKSFEHELPAVLAAAPLLALTDPHGHPDFVAVAPIPDRPPPRG